VFSYAVAGVVGALVPGAAQATVAFDGTTAYTQDFNTLPTNPTTNYRTWFDDNASPPVTGGGSSSSPGAGLAGWFIQSTLQNSVATGSYQRFRVSTGSQNTGSIYSFGSSLSDVDRALGSIGSTTVKTQYYALRLQNTSNQVITSFTLTYDGEQYRDGGNSSGAAQTLSFGYSVEAGSIQDSTFTDVTALDFTSPVHGTSSATLNGNMAANRTPGITSTISGLNWEPGQDLWLRWTDVDNSGNDHGLAIDNVVFTGTLSGVSGVAGSPTWKTDADGTWGAGDTSNWLNANAPTGSAGGLVRLGSQITADRTVTLATSPTVSTLEFNGGAHSYTLAASGGNQLNVAAGGSIVTNGVSFDSDNLPSPTGNVISAPVNFATDASFRVNDPLGKLTVTGPITVGAGGGLTLAGAGSVSLPAGFIWSGPTTIDGASLSVSTPTQLGDGSPTNTLVLRNGGTINAMADMTMTRGLTVGSGGGMIAFANANNVTFTGPLTGTGTFTKQGPGTVSVAGANVGGLYIEGNTRNVGENGGTVQIAPDSPTSVINFLRLETDKDSGIYLGTLDLTNNTLVYDYTGDSPFLGATKSADNGLTNSKVYTAVWYASDHGKWNNTVGITSSYINSDDNDPSHVHAIALAEASDLGITGTATWHGQTIDSTAVLLLYTLAGDANMNGKIDADDYAIIDRNLAKNAFPTTDGGLAGTAGSLAHWVNGDFNYDGAVDSADLLLVDKSLAVQNGGVLSAAFLAEREAEYGDAYVSALVASVPEPGSLSLLAIGAASILGGRRRRSC
jgi:hypothetical protein